MFALTALTKSTQLKQTWLCTPLCVWVCVSRFLWGKYMHGLFFPLVTHYEQVKYALANGTSFGFKWCFAERVCALLLAWLCVCISARRRDWGVGGYRERRKGRQTLDAALSNYWQVQCVVLRGLFQHDFIQRKKCFKSFLLLISLETYL